MKTIYLLLLLSLNSIANTTNPENYINENPKTTIETFCNNEIIKEPSSESDSISGLKIVSYDSQKHGKHIYIISDMYTMKKISFFNKKGRKVFTTSTIGSPIYLSKFKKGAYTIKIVENEKTETKEFSIN
ncbi:MAG: hypothetical protein ABI549_01475 [Flavobacterium sp.]|uniref:hypothetical protein n=1 Tax=Flavobacterium sp. TaxID=239 RepID=UPI003265F2AB